MHENGRTQGTARQEPCRLTLDPSPSTALSALSMTDWIKRIHMYTGLLNVTALAVFGIIGIAATALPSPRDRTPPEATVELRDFVVPGGMDDRQLADHIQMELAIPLTGSAPDWSLYRDRDSNLHFRLPTPARRYDITVLEAEHRLRLQMQPFDNWQYLFHLHEMNPGHAGSDPRIQAWAWYIEFSIWALITMALSGVYLWLAQRPGYRWAQISFASGVFVFVAFYVAVR